MMNISSNLSYKSQQGLQFLKSKVQFILHFFMPLGYRYSAHDNNFVFSIERMQPEFSKAQSILRQSAFCASLHTVRVI